MKSFGKHGTQYYDLDKPQPPADTLDFYLKQVDLTEGPILEPMCRSGRFLIPLMPRGFDLTEVDSPPEMLSACRRRALKLELTPDLRRQFLNKLAIHGNYPLVKIPSGSSVLITDLFEVRESLRRFYNRMASEDRFVLKIDRLLEEPDPHPETGESTIKRPDGVEIKLISSGSFYPEKWVYRGLNRYELFFEGQVISQEFEQFDLCYYELHPLTHLFEDSGFLLFKYVPLSIRVLLCQSGKPVLDRCGILAAVGKSDLKKYLHYSTLVRRY